MRADAIGLFWEDRPPEKKAKKEKIVRVPPQPVWLSPDYLPNLDEARAFIPDLFTDEELVKAMFTRERLVWDTESYPNYWCACFKSLDSGKALIFEINDDLSLNFVPQKLQWVLENFLLVDFNGDGYDKWTAALAVLGSMPIAMYEMTKRIIEYHEQPYKVARNMKAKKLSIDHIDLFELTPLGPSLKTMAGRLDAPMMMDLPFKPGTHLLPDQITITRWYCFNDLSNTELTYWAHEKNIKLRENFGPRYGIDLRSKSDAQMAEAIFKAEFKKRTGYHVAKPKIVPGHTFYFKPQPFIKFQTPNLQWLFNLICSVPFVIGYNGYVISPPELEKMVVPIGDAEYKVGIGGLHSREKKAGHVAGKRWILRDFDVSSYYPKAMLASGLYPPAIGEIFRPIFQNVVDERLAAKAIEAKGTTAEGLKIVVNGTFGKTMDPWSCLYFPEFGMQTTIAGQLCLLMAIEALYLAGIQVINANTDGIVVKARIDQADKLKAVFDWWEKQTSLEMETTDYTMLFSRDVNNYIAFKPEGEPKAKGVFGPRGLKKNTVTEICSTAALQYILTGKPIEDTVRECRDFPEFLAMRQVNGGGVKVYPDRTEYIGKVARWYYPVGEVGEIITAKKGHVVGDTQEARPCMRLPVEFPTDINYDWYIERAYGFLNQIGYTALIESGEVPPLTTRSIENGKICALRECEDDSEDDTTESTESITVDSE